VVKGRTQPVPVYEIVGLKEDVTESTRECLRLFDAGMKAYLSKDWAHAIALFEQSARVEPNQPDPRALIELNPSLVMLERCRRLSQHAPAPDWDGVYVMRDK
jgi:adenylate cyclase